MITQEAKTLVAQLHWILLHRKDMGETNPLGSIEPKTLSYQLRSFDFSRGTKQWRLYV
jgi:hypothetical protein